MSAAPTYQAPELAGDMVLFLLTKSSPKLRRSCCSPYHDHEGGCKRPVWGDGRVDGEFYGYCSRCWHLHNCFHGHYTTMQANPAAAKLDGVGIQRLTFGATLPAVGAHQPDVFPESWL